MYSVVLNNKRYYLVSSIDTENYVGHSLITNDDTGKSEWNIKDTITFDKQKSVDGIVLGRNAETGVIILGEDPQWVWSREAASGSYIELRLDKQYGYVLNVIQGEFEQYDFELGGVENAITINQN